MGHTRFTAEETLRRGEEIYERRLREQVEAGNIGKYIVINVDTGEYEIGDDYMSLARHALARQPDAALCTLRIGYPALGRIGGRFTPSSE
jgi:hypothetical protein